MKKLIKVWTVFTFSCLSLPCFAADDCNPEFDPFCGHDSGYGDLDKAVGKVVLGGAVIVGVGLYLMFRTDNEDKEKHARMMADYRNGRGLRLTSYESIFNLSLFSQTTNITYETPIGFSDQFKVRENTYNLVNLSLHWQ